MKYTVPCDFDPPARRSVELSNGKWSDREWMEGEKAAYRDEVLRKPARLPAEDSLS